MLNAVIVGCAASQATIDTLKVQLKSRPDLCHVTLEQMVRHPDEFRFER